MSLSFVIKVLDDLIDNLLTERYYIIRYEWYPDRDVDLYDIEDELKRLYYERSIAIRLRNDIMDY